MEAFMYRCHPQTARLVELIRSGVIGEVRLIESAFCFDFGDQPQNVRAQAALSGGGIMDVGCYPVSLARLVAGAALDLPGPAEPLEVRGSAAVHPAWQVDTRAVAVLKFPGDILAHVTCGMQLNASLPTVIHGSKGRIVVPHPWFPGQDEASSRLEVHLAGRPEPEVHAAPGSAPLYAIEVDTVARFLAERQAPPPCMSWADTLGNMRTLDIWRRWVGVTFPCEQPSGLKHSILGRRPARPRRPVVMPTGRIPGVAKPVARIILGTMGHAMVPFSKACAMLDRYFEAGGNALDTAFLYNTEQIIGDWLKLRGLRRQIVLIAKAGHAPKPTPQMASDQLLQSLERLQTDYVDLFLLHRDNPAVPAGEFVDMLNGHLRAGRIRAFGGSNWTIRRLEAANAYARRRKLRGFTASSPQFSLACWNEPMWTNCVTAVDRASRRWYARTGMPLLAWSSQANGFFSGRYRPDDPARPVPKDVARVWFNTGNFTRLQRAEELAREKHCTAVQIALAYVLHQPLNIFPIIGPETIAELRDSLGALTVELTDSERAWLNLERPTIPPR